MTQNLNKGGYNEEALRFFRKKTFWRTVLKRSTFLAVGLACLFVVADYLANLPRERAAKKYREEQRIRLGFETALNIADVTINREQSDPKNTKLPIAEIYIRGKKLDKLTEHLPKSGRHFEKAKVKIGGKEYKAKVKIRGDSINHWAFPAKSWRVELSGSKFYDGMKSFNLVVPRVKFQLANWLGYEIARRIGGELLVPESNLVHFR